MKLVSVVGARPNFMKIAPLIRAIAKHNAALTSPPLVNLLVHTGQHYDYEMSRVFFEDLELPEPDVYLGAGSGTHAAQTAKILAEMEQVLLKQKPDLTIVVGDVNSTLAAALAAVKLHLPVAHVEAGLRSFERDMPEEINRRLTDQIADYLFTPSSEAGSNLLREGIPAEKIHFVGNVMIDSLLYCREKALGRAFSARIGLEKYRYCVLTLHRAENVDSEKNLERIISTLYDISRELDIVFPCHPRTRKMIESRGLLRYFDVPQDGLPDGNYRSQGLHLMAPLGYLDFLSLVMESKFVITDSGGVQEETTFLNIPCLTLRDSTERPVTLTEGTNVLVGPDCRGLKEEIAGILSSPGRSRRVPDLWDGRAAERIIAVIAGQGEHPGKGGAS